MHLGFSISGSKIMLLIPAQRDRNPILYPQELSQHLKPEMLNHGGRMIAMLWIAVLQSVGPRTTSRGPGLF